MTDLSKKLQIKHHFVLAHTPWANGTVERCNSTLLTILRSLVSELRLQFSDWPTLPPLVRHCLNTLSRRSLGNRTPLEIFTGHKPVKALNTVFVPRLRDLVSSWRLSTSAISEQLTALAQAVDNIHQHVAKSRSAARARVNARRKHPLPNFSIGDFVLVGLPTHKNFHKLHVRWTGPSRIVEPVSPYLYRIQDLITRVISTVHVSRLRFYHDASLNITEALRRQIAHDDAGFEIDHFKGWRHNPDAKRWEIHCSWRGFTADEDSWEPLTSLYADVPVFLKRYLQKHRTDPLVSQMLSSLPKKGQ
jgi:hypothetical protein